MHIRKALPKDNHKLLELCRHFSTSPYTFDKRFSELTDSLYPAFAADMLKSPSSFSLLIEDNTKIAGFITAGFNPQLTSLAGKGIGNILLLVVDQAYRGKNYGRMLVQKACAFLHTMGTDIITVGTDIYNLPAIHVYESCGFKTQMAWHIFRHYPGNEKRAKAREEIDLYHDASLESFSAGFCRPVSLLKENNIETSALREHLLENFRKGIRKGQSTALQYFKNGNPAGLINIGKDEIAQKTLQNNKTIYKILDLIVLDEYQNQGIEKALLLDATSRYFDYSVMEFWIEVNCSTLIQAAEAAGFNLSYTGVSLHLVKL